MHLRYVEEGRGGEGGACAHVATWIYTWIPLPDPVLSHITVILSFRIAPPVPPPLSSSQVLTSIGQLPHLEPFLNSLHDCKYKEFFRVSVKGFGGEGVLQGEGLGG